MERQNRIILALASTALAAGHGLLVFLRNKFVSLLGNKKPADGFTAEDLLLLSKTHDAATAFTENDRQLLVKIHAELHPQRGAGA